MQDKIFIDTNIYIYMKVCSENIKKHELSKELLNNKNIILTTQVIKELSNVLIKKNIDKIILKKFINYIYSLCEVKNISQDELINAITIKEKYKFQYFDSLIIASALANKCSILYSEDMQHGQIIENSLTIINPLIKDA